MNLGIISQKADVQLSSKLVKNTAMLLAVMMAAAALASYINMHMGVFVSPVIFVLAVFLFSFLIHNNRGKSIGVLYSLLFTSFVGFAFGPAMDKYLNMAGGGLLVMNAFIGTVFVFAGASLFALFKRPTVGSVFYNTLSFIVMAMIAMSLVNFYFLKVGLLSTVIASVIFVVSSIYLTLTMTSVLYNESESYISAATSIFSSLFNVFTSLLSLFNAGTDWD